MADKMYVIITLRKEIPDRNTGRLICDLVKNRLSDRPDVILTAHITDHLDLEEPTP